MQTMPNNYAERSGDSLEGGVETMVRGRQAERLTAASNTKLAIYTQYGQEIFKLTQTTSSNQESATVTITEQPVTLPVGGFSVESSPSTFSNHLPAELNPEVARLNAYAAHDNALQEQPYAQKTL